MNVVGFIGRAVPVTYRSLARTLLTPSRAALHNLGGGVKRGSLLVTVRYVSSKSVNTNCVVNRLERLVRLSPDNNVFDLSSPFCLCRAEPCRGTFTFHRRQLCSGGSSALTLEMPSLSPTMEKGNIASWNVKVPACDSLIHMGGRKWRSGNDAKRCRLAMGLRLTRPPARCMLLRTAVATIWRWYCA